MKIIKNGQYKRDTVEFECSNCGCIFKADATEYVPASQTEMIHDNIIASCTCPWCKKIAYKHYH